MAEKIKIKKLALPMSWAVLNDGSDKFKYLVIYYMNKTYGGYNFKQVNDGYYYGVRKDRSNG
ncbi:MAG: hypothetical protein AABY22_36245, partial [Nanoarchaeota archaeon]